ncbi:ubiquinol-cytochrome c reductase complex 14 kda [Lecanosticta acicola]|uniref:Cytochrome b-c1 complex subunit 7 n=1 Tax=Lecanosticta acicola TaxID=111012 RepID=A0AAI9E5M8_9PEZI|nr:ubiquinol-cytochrome c reductase complex 14 kda [Lecanosticta acicola]
MSTPSLAPFINKRPWLKRWMQPLSKWYLDNSGYRKLGLRADDLIPEESPEVQLALKRLSPKEAYDRVFRMRRAFQCSLAHQLLPRHEWTTDEQDYPYLSPIIKEIETSKKEREDLDTIQIRKHAAKGT